MRFRFLNQRYRPGEIWKLKNSVFKILFNYKKMYNLLLFVLSRLFKKEKALNAPLTMMIEPSSRCDMFCPMCPIILNRTNRPKGDMEFSTFKKVIDEVGDRLLFLALWNYGEPLMNPKIFEMIRYANKKYIITVMSSNLLSLDSHKINELLLSELDYLIVSFDGATRDTYERFRGKGNFDKVLSNLRLLIRQRKALKKSKPFINMQLIVMKENEHEIDLIRSLCVDLGVDRLSIKKFTYLGGEEVRRFLPTKQEFIYGKYKGIDNFDTCMRVLDSSVILWDGSVIPCCGDLDFIYIFGNINQGSRFMDIWNNPRYLAFRKQVFKNLSSVDMCERCPSKNYTTDMFVENE